MHEGKHMGVMTTFKKPTAERAEDAPSRTRHLITNIEVEEGDTAAELHVYSNYLVYSTRGETEQDFYVGQRQDVLRHVDGAWKIARRKIILRTSCWRRT